MAQDLEKLYMNQMTRHKLYKLFGIKRVGELSELNDWLSISTNKLAK